MTTRYKQLITLTVTKPVDDGGLPLKLYFTSERKAANVQFQLQRAGFVVGGFYDPRPSLDRKPKEAVDTARAFLGK